MFTSSELGEQFNLREANPDPGGGLLYAIRYSPEALDLKMHAILDRIFEWGFEFVEVKENSIGIQPTSDDVDLEYDDRIPILAEELSLINDARCYQSYGWGIDQNSVSELIDAVSAQANHTLDNALTGSTEGKIEAFDTATMFIPQIIIELLIADAQNGVLTISEKAKLDSLGNLAAFIGRAVDGRHIIIGR